MSLKKVKRGDIVIIKEGIGIVRYVGELDGYGSDVYIGIELKGSNISIKNGNNGEYNDIQYFKCKQRNRGIFVRSDNILRILNNEELVDKLSFIYDIVNGTKRNIFQTEFIHRSYYRKLLDQYNIIKGQRKEFDNLVLEYAILKEQIQLFKQKINIKDNENMQLHNKIAKAEKKIGRSLSQIDLDSLGYNVYVQYMFIYVCLF